MATLTNDLAPASHNYALRNLFRAITLAAVAGAFAVNDAQASGYGSVWHVSRTTTTIRVGWSHPGWPKLRYATGASNRYRVCYKRNLAWGSACSHNSRYTNSDPYTITGLTPDTKYKIKVYAWTEKFSWGKWRNKKYRLVGTVRIRTAAPVPHGDLFFDGWADQGFGFGTLAGHVDWSAPAQYDLIQVGYKFRGSLARLNNTLSVRGRPSSRWTVSDENRGWVSFNPASTSTNYGFAWVLNCRNYKIAAYAFKIGSSVGTKIDDISGRAGGSCRSRKSVGQSVNDDHSNIMQAWAQKLVAAFGHNRKGSVRAALAKRFPQFARKLSTLIEDNEIGADDYELLEYFVEHEPALFEAWQAHLAPIGLTLLGQVPHTLRSSIEDELETKNESTMPRFATGQKTNVASALPFGQSRGLLQSWYAGATMQKRLITAIGWRAVPGAIAGPTKHRIEIIVANTQRHGSQLSRKFASNLPSNAVKFMPMTTISMPALIGPANPNKAMLWIKGRRPFVFAGPNLIVQTRTETSRTFQSIRGRQTQAIQADTNQSVTTKSGWSCAGELEFAHRVTRQGASTTLTASHVAPGRPVIFMLGFDHTKLAGILPLPMSLDAFGMESCQLAVDPILQITTLANRNGQAVLRLRLGTPVPDLELHAQAMHFARVTASGLATTNAAHLLLGSGHCNELYNLTRDGGVAEFGPFRTNRGSVLLVR